MLRGSWKASMGATVLSMAVVGGLSSAGGSEVPEFDGDLMPCVAASRVGDAGRLRFSPYRPDMVSTVRTEEPLVALGLDDGPDDRFTVPVLELLADHGATATFFLVGRHVDRHPDLVRSIAEAGHEIANHTVDHRNLIERSESDIAASLAGAEEAISRVGVGSVPLLRPPRGRQDEVAAEAACRLGYRSIGWADTLERHLGPVEARAMAESLEPGDIVLAHDGGGDRTQSVTALEVMLDVLADRGIEVVSVGELLDSVGVAAGR